MCAAARRLGQLLGRRGVFLAIVGTGKTCWGVGMLVDPPPGQGLRLLTNLCGLQHWAWLWIIAGVITASSAFVQVGRDWIGFVAALIPPTVWAISYTVAVINGDYSRGAYVALWYLTSHVGVIMWAAAVPEYSVPHAPRPARKGGTP
ncbi:hypothetical protein C9F11_37260 [Streptomyces sp. YIM 121038]|uniref:hypothetical protein n=1 Tax=Streptomyces sp. YIM 121038 TaxID=2136401 RepID=UPI0011104D8D|nr:hypothetical protein [Streptomyces sp. YIM 121038]QCX81035.1 hypothetical protein C9F11_37260 [Streptomyces sp. YIM 121038]